MSPPAPDPRPRTTVDVRRILYWVYFGRVTAVLGAYGTALFVGEDWFYSPPGFPELSVRGVAIGVVIAAALVTAAAYWVSHRRGEPPSVAFIVWQAVFDVVLVTGIVLLAGGSDTVFAPLFYIALVSGYALITPLATGLLIAAATALSYLTVILVAYQDQLGLAIFLQTAIFATVACVSGLIGGRLREVRGALGSLERELSRVRLGTADILRTLDAAVLTLDGEGRAVYLNPAAASLFGLEDDHWIGEIVVARIGQRSEGVAGAVEETLETGRPVRGREVDVDLGGSTPQPYSVSTAPLEREGEPTLVTLVMQDLEMARQVEELHLRTGRLEAVAELSASLAHEIRNPLASIRSAVEQIADPRSDAEDRATLGSLVIREADRLSRLLGEFNDFARVDVAERTPIDLDRIVREAIEVVAQRPEALDRAAFEVEIAAGLDDLWGDPDLVHRTLTNLLLNAVQVSDPDGSVMVRVVADSLSPAVPSPGLTSGMPVRIRVVDDGPGIAPEDIGRIFDPFYTRRQGGSGMGLAIAHRAVQAHGGALLVSSTPGQGATFVVVLPRRQPHARQRFAAEGGLEQVSSRVGATPVGARPRESTALDGYADRLG